MAVAVETLAGVAETATPPLTYSGNKEGPLSVNLSLPLSSRTKGCRVRGGVQGWEVWSGPGSWLGIASRFQMQLK